MLNDKKSRKPIDQDLKRKIESLTMKPIISITISVSAFKVIEEEHHRNKFGSRSTCVEYFLRKGFETEGIEIVNDKT